MTDTTNDGTESPNSRPLGQLSPDEYYRITFHAVRDALLDVIGTLLLVVVALVLVWIGGAAAVSPAAGEFELGLGLGIAIIGLYLAATTLDIIPPIQEWR